MKILYDHQMFSLQKYGGITRYFTEIINNMPGENKLSLSLIFSDNFYLTNSCKVFKKINPLPERSFKGKKTLKKIIYNINQSYSRKQVSKNNFDLFHPTFYDPYFLDSLKKPFIITVHDLIACKFKDTYYKNSPVIAQMEKIIPKAERIIAVSESTKRDVIDFFKISSEKIDVIYHGYNEPYLQKKKNQYGKYLLYVGNREHYKNFNLFAKAITPLLHKEPGLKLVCVGRPFDKQETEFLNSLNILKQIFLLNADENELSNLYSNALAFVYPSLYEGFGMPILEAFANDCPVCVSDISSMPEVAGDAGVYFNPYDPDSILISVEKVLNNKDFTADMIKKGRNRLQHFSWEKAAQETMISYQKVINQPLNLNHGF